MKKMFCVQSVLTALLLTGIGAFGVPSASAQQIKQLKNPADVKIKTEVSDEKADAAATPADNAAVMNAENTSSQSYSVVIESKIGADGKRVQTKKVWKDGVLVEDEEKTVEGTDTDGDTAIELDGQIAPGIVLRSERSGDLPLGEIDPNLSQDEMMKQMNEQMRAMRARHSEMMKRFGLPGFGPNAGPFGDPDGDQPFALPITVTPSAYWLGAVIAPVPPETAAQLGLADGVGVVLRDIVPNSPAAKAGLQKYDILIQLGETPVGDPASIGQTLDKTEGKPIQTEYYRQGKLETVELTPEKRPEAPEAVQPTAADESDHSAAFGSNEKIRVVRPGMIVPADEAETVRENAAPAETPATAPAEKPAETPEK